MKGFSRICMTTNNAPYHGDKCRRSPLLCRRDAKNFAGMALTAKVTSFPAFRITRNSGKGLI